MDSRQALLIAWITWFVLASFPFFVFLAVMFRQLYGEVIAAPEAVIHRWFVGTMILVGLIVPGSFFLQGRSFRAYWKGEPVSPRDYLRGMITIWMSLEISGLVALLGCWMTGSILPNLLPALVAFMLFCPLWPNGHAMTRPLVSEHDGADYEEPR